MRVWFSCLTFGGQSVECGQGERREGMSEKWHRSERGVDEMAQMRLRNVTRQSVKKGRPVSVRL